VNELNSRERERERERREMVAFVLVGRSLGLS